MTVVVEKTETTPAVETAAPNDLAPWHIRAGAFTIDVLPGVAVVATMALVASTVPLRSTSWWLCISVLATVTVLTWVNRVVWPANRGWSLGRAVTGIAVVRADNGTAGLGRLTLRELAHLSDTISVFVGWLWPMWDARRRTFADLLVGTEVRSAPPDERPGNARRLAAVVALSAALLCVGGATSSFVVVYMHDRAAEQARAAISEQGPKIVAEMLTYDPKTLKKDFARAQSLTTEKYRPQLAAQQDAVDRGHPVVNEYWVTNQAILSAAPDRATMLLFMRGHRGGEEGEGKQERFITATVRVSFVKSADSRWLVDDLTVVTKPKAPRGEK